MGWKMERKKIRGNRERKEKRKNVQGKGESVN
jgi:hypothetical protein